MSVPLSWSPAEALAVEASAFVTKSGVPITIRLLQAGDAAALDDFIHHGLSPASRQRFGAHKPEQPAADVCSAIGSDDTVRIVAITDSSSGESIVGYLILMGTLPEKEEKRYRDYGRSDVVDGRSVRLAPAVADAFHGQGVGRALVAYAVKVAAQLGIDDIVLWGGTHDDNANGRALYERTGFKYVGTFETDRPDLKPDGPITNHDMVLHVADELPVSE